VGGAKTLKLFHFYKPRGASPRHDYRSDEDGTILAHNYILHGSDWFGRSKKGGTLRGLRIK